LLYLDVAGEKTASMPGTVAVADVAVAAVSMEWPYESCN
jgi:hypothetical protein